MAYECPLCGTDFEHADCRHGCPLSSGCAMVRCPRCGYEFVESGKFTDMLRRWIRRPPKPAPAPAPAPETPDVCRLTDLETGATASIAFIAPTSSARINKLASFGLVPGSEVRLVQRRPAVVLQCGATSIAVEDEIGREIFVRVDAA
ncbi:MAG TPA: FeoA family protein [Thermoanaerobaculia bacterium]|nr:FeoA family protein [Thermoanaerobaculia bacterium]